MTTKKILTLGQERAIAREFLRQALNETLLDEYSNSERNKRKRAAIYKKLKELEKWK